MHLALVPGGSKHSLPTVGSCLPASACRKRHVEGDLDALVAAASKRSLSTVGSCRPASVYRKHHVEGQRHLRFHHDLRPGSAVVRTKTRDDVRCVHAQCLRIDHHLRPTIARARHGVQLCASNQQQIEQFAETSVGMRHQGSCTDITHNAFSLRGFILPEDAGDILSSLQEENRPTSKFWLAVKVQKVYTILPALANDRSSQYRQRLDEIAGFFDKDDLEKIKAAIVQAADKATPLTVRKQKRQRVEGVAELSCLKKLVEQLQ